MPELISVIVTTYNREDALEAVLSALSQQTDRNFEVVVADDGSGPATAALIERWQPRLGVPLSHVWQVDRGFRAAEIRNRAILARTRRLLRLPRRRLHCACRTSSAPTGGLPNRAGSSPATACCCLAALTAAVLRDGLQPQAWTLCRMDRQRAARRRQSARRRAAVAARPAAQAAAGEMAGRAFLQSRGLARRISTGSMVSMRASAAGDARIPISWCGSSMPACAARTDALPPA